MAAHDATCLPPQERERAQAGKGRIESMLELEVSRDVEPAVPRPIPMIPRLRAPGFLAGGREQVVPRALVVLLRLQLGAVFFLASLDKLREGSHWPVTMAGHLERWLPRSYGFYRGFLEKVVLPHKQVFGTLLVAGEMLIGLALLAGLLTRLFALAALVLNLNILLALGFPLVSPTADSAFIFADLVVLLGAAGRAYGLDYFLARRWPACPLW